MGVFDGDLEAALWVSSGVLTVASIGICIAVAREAGVTSRIELSEIIENFRFCARSYVQNLLGQIHERIDLFTIVYFLADPDASSFVTGQAIVADGGALAHLSTE